VSAVIVGEVDVTGQSVRSAGMQSGRKRAPVMTAGRKDIGGTRLAIMVSLKPARPLSRRHHWLSGVSGAKIGPLLCQATQAQNYCGTVQAGISGMSPLS